MTDQSTQLQPGDIIVVSGENYSLITEPRRFEGVIYLTVNDLKDSTNSPIS